MKSLTRRQEDVTNYIEEHRATHGYSPTIREIGEGLGIKSSSTVHRHVQKLIDKGASKAI
ncbi:LexA family protein [Salimicrobium flavidum]|uniref:Repressor LexA n=1 Tax=Salimicrobium flavidum TaxID=570947 RepID=A0A1N7KHM3_9BACI|nr:hypothetical protein [Salimicrobium flavidum]SIS61047.1 repressor LexA [Salimicrobium flavidum]